MTVIVEKWIYLLVSLFYSEYVVCVVCSQTSTVTEQNFSRLQSGEKERKQCMLVASYLGGASL